MRPNRFRGLETRPYDIDLDRVMRVLTENKFNLIGGRKAH